jgi:hypothetical protein
MYPLYINIINILGEVVHTQKVYPSGMELNEEIRMNEGLADGIYIIHVLSETGSYSLRFVVRNNRP